MTSTTGSNEEASCLEEAGGFPSIQEDAIDPALRDSSEGSHQTMGNSQEGEKGGGKKRGKENSGVRVHLKDEKQRTALVRLCVNNFAGYDMGRDKYLRSMGPKFEELHGVKAPDVKSAMYRWETQRRKEVRDNQTASGVAVARSDYEQAMDEWIQLVDDFEKKLQGGKKRGSASAGDSGKERAAAARELMLKKLKDKREEEEAALYWDSDTEREKDDSEGEPESRRKRQRGDQAGKEGKGFRENAFLPRGRQTDRVLAMIKSENQRFTETMERMDERRWNKMCEVLQTGSGAGSTETEELLRETKSEMAVLRQDQEILRRDIQGTREDLNKKLDMILEFIQNSKSSQS